jgi:hypothetical protein
MYDKLIEAKLAQRNKERTLQNEKLDRNGPLLGQRKNHILLLNFINGRFQHHMAFNDANEI